MFRLVLNEGRDLIAQHNAIEERAFTLLKDDPNYQLLIPIRSGIFPGHTKLTKYDNARLRNPNGWSDKLLFCSVQAASGSSLNETYPKSK